jgi:hypothetical protein
MVDGAARRRWNGTTAGEAAAASRPMASTGGTNTGWY